MKARGRLLPANDLLVPAEQAERLCCHLPIFSLRRCSRRSHLCHCVNQLRCHTRRRASASTHCSETAAYPHNSKAVFDEPKPKPKPKPKKKGTTKIMSSLTRWSENLDFSHEYGSFKTRINFVSHDPVQPGGSSGDPKREIERKRNISRERDQKIY